MDASHAMRAMIERAGLTHAQIETRAARYGGWVGQTLARPRPGADLLASLARACGYRLELVPMDGGDAITIGPDEMGECTTRPDDIARARALLGRAMALLDSVASSSD